LSAFACRWVGIGRGSEIRRPRGIALHGDGVSSEGCSAAIGPKRS
jgi:hypothetical protein